MAGIGASFQSVKRNLLEAGGAEYPGQTLRVGVLKFHVGKQGAIGMIPQLIQRRLFLVACGAGAEGSALAVLHHRCVTVILG